MAISHTFFPQQSYDDKWYIAAPHLPDAGTLEGKIWDTPAGDYDNFYLVSPPCYPFIENWGDCNLSFIILNDVLESGMTMQAQFVRCTEAMSIIEWTGLRNFDTYGNGISCIWSDIYTFGAGSITDRVAVHLQMYNSAGAIRHYRFKVGDNGILSDSTIYIEFDSSITTKEKRSIRTI